jgi:hypothetical protein
MGKWRMFILGCFAATWFFMHNMSNTIESKINLDETTVKEVSALQDKIKQINKNFDEINKDLDEDDADILALAKVIRRQFNRTERNMQLIKSLFPKTIDIWNEQQFWNWDPDKSETVLITLDSHVWEGP